MNAIERSYDGRPRYIFISPVLAEWLRGYRDPFDNVANRVWLFRTFGVRGL